MSAWGGKRSLVAILSRMLTSRSIKRFASALNRHFGRQPTIKMRYREESTPTTVQGLQDRLVWVSAHAQTRSFPDYSDDFDGSFFSLERGVENLRKRLGDELADQAIDMIRQAKAHYEANDGLGTRLIQDIEEIIRSRPPFAYPKRLYRWPRPAETADPDFAPLPNVDPELFRELQLLLEMHHEYPDHDFSRDREAFRGTIRRRSGELGEAVLDQLSDMMLEVDVHYNDGSPGYGHCLMMDIRRILCGLEVPFSYPRKLFKWGLRSLTTE